MKISIDIEATPDEVREFFGWPPIQPLQQELIRVMQENMNKGVAGFEPLSLMKSLFPMPMQGLENMQKVFSDAMKAAGGTKASEKAAPKNPSLAILFYCYAIGPPLWSNPYSREEGLSCISPLNG